MKKKLLASLFFVLALFGVCGMAAPSEALAAEQIGYVNVQKVFNNYPDVRSAISAIDLERQNAQKQFNEQSASLDDNGKADLNKKLSEQVNSKEKEMLGPIQKKISEAIVKVAKAQGIGTVLDSSTIVFGGKDLTEAVITEVAK
ncbi:OmpH family outer membrane protein [Sporomusa aerivorans]|uniref:OmpH family outer membrane protein n=1 Tax=Sporomusa aerivorans TaxID=204936 RepID=UPI00352B5E6E